MGVIVNAKTSIVVEECAWPGVKRIAGYVADDMQKVFGIRPQILSKPDTSSVSVCAVTIGKSEILTQLCDEGRINVQDMTGLREVYRLCELDGNLLIIGSDKRGTIYGLFRLSEMLGVSPFVNWGDVRPLTADEIVIDENQLIISKEPSVKYRGFFINDEWPAFGNWSEKRFGGFNAKCYERVFELLLRLKGNYMWPAMWSAQFNLDGPGLENARLADEMGVIMGMSHHEPCCRNGEEYKYVRGEGSIYGDDWNFVRNRDGITKFWEDGLKRNAEFENVITVGMRGEADSTILGHEATLKDNIEYLRDVLTTQEKLIAECVNPDVSSVPRMLALYKEVEPFFYGDEETPGLMGAKELDGVTLMLCDDNFGNLRTIPTDEMREHKGGYGMYYHFDYHGSPVSYEWINTSYLPKVWEQMTTAYENGIKELWIVNVGDIFSTEFPLSFFLDLAYDFDKWGSTNVDAPLEYTRLFAEKLFPEWAEGPVTAVANMLHDYTYIAHCRRTETLNAEVILQNGADRSLDDWYSEVTRLMEQCEFYREFCAPEETFKFFEFVYYPLMGNMNMQKMWLLAAKNKYLASINAICANDYESQIDACLEYDRILVDELHSLNDGFWYGMGMSEHIGFAYWNEEECKYPVIHRVYPTAKARIVAVVPETLDHSEGGDWTKKTLVMMGETVELFATSMETAAYSIETNDDFISVCPAEGVIEGGKHKSVRVEIDYDKAGDKLWGEFIIHWSGGNIEVRVPLDIRVVNFYVPADNYFSAVIPEGAAVQTLPNYGIYKSGVRNYPLATNYAQVAEENADNVPKLIYNIDVPVSGDYRITLYMSPSNPPFIDNKVLVRIGINDEDPMTVNVVPSDFKVGDNQIYWSDGVLDNIRTWSTKATLKKGANMIALSALSIGVVFERIGIQLV